MPSPSSAAVVGVPVIIVALWAAVSGPAEPTGGSAPWLVLAASFLLQAVVIFVTFNLWKELAWMGFVQARLQQSAPAAAAGTAAAAGIVAAAGLLDDKTPAASPEIGHRP